MHGIGARTIVFVLIYRQYSLFNLVVPPDFRFGGSTQPDNSFSGRNFGVMAASPFYEDSEFLSEEDICEERTDYVFAKRPGSSWTARLCHIGIEEETLCEMQGVSLSTLEEIWSATSIDSLTEQVLSAFQIPEVTPIGLLQQFGLQRELSRTTFSVQS